MGKHGEGQHSIASAVIVVICIALVFAAVIALVIFDPHWSPAG